MVLDDKKIAGFHKNIAIVAQNFEVRKRCSDYRRLLTAHRLRRWKPQHPPQVIVTVIETVDPRGCQKVTKSAEYARKENLIISYTIQVFLAALSPVNLSLV